MGSLSLQCTELFLLCSARARNCKLRAHILPFAISVLLVLFSSLVVGVNVYYCPQDHCAETCVGCANLPQLDCCEPAAGQGAVFVLVTNADIDVPTHLEFYINDGCNRPISNRQQNGNGCQPSSMADYTGTSYYTTPPPPVQFPKTDAYGPQMTCSGRKVMPNAAFFSKPRQTGEWVLPNPGRVYFPLLWKS